MNQIAAPWTLRDRISDYISLTKPGITTFVVLSAAVGYYMALAGAADPRVLFVALMGTGLSSAGACALNMVLEREGDAKMARTRNRPLPAGRISVWSAYAFGLALTLAGVGGLALGVGPVAALISAAIVVGYLFAYTPLKPVSSWSTWVGIPVGAAPPLIGWVAARGTLDAGAWILFGIVSAWQVPHIMAMAWMNRGDLLDAEYPLAPVEDGSERRAAAQMLGGLLVLLVVSWLPFGAGIAGLAYLVPAAIIGLGFTWYGLRFALSPTVRHARSVFLASLAYLPLSFLALVIGKI